MPKMMVGCPHCEELRERIAMLERLLGMGDDVPACLGLSGIEVDIFGLLMRREMCSKGFLMDAVYGGRAGDPPDERIIDVYICRLRKKLDPFGIVITTVMRRGWSLQQEYRAEVYRMLGGENAADRKAFVRAGAAPRRPRSGEAADMGASVGGRS